MRFKSSQVKNEPKEQRYLASQKFAEILFDRTVLYVAAGCYRLATSEASFRRSDNSR
jgi:hypothetical protein